MGNTVSYRQIIVGEVGGFQLANNSQYVLIDVYIADKYASLVKSNSKFWHASGVQIDFGILSGAEFHTESVENIVLGGIAFATPNEDSVDSAKNGQVFKLYQRHKQKWLDWTPEIALSNQAHGNKVND